MIFEGTDNDVNQSQNIEAKKKYLYGVKKRKRKKQKNRENKKRINRNVHKFIFSGYKRTKTLCHSRKFQGIKNW